MNLNLNKREKIAVTSAAVFLSLFIISQFIIVPVFEKRDDLRQQLIDKKDILLDMKILQSEYVTMKEKLESSRQGLKKRPGNFTLFSFLDRLAGDTGLKDHIAYMKPSTSVKEDSGLKISRVELKLQEVTIKDLTSYLFKVETTENMVIVKRLSIIKTGKNTGLVNAVLQVETFES
ncbi:MAG: type II secretion system protein M [Desulfobacteraceae bacterium]|nr:type II secretion system protein M [Desulfobacteraceae bacterium]MBC2755766.1 type II secretion system protein M [Desulfobacteraceae bacterium]